MNKPKFESLPDWLERTRPYHPLNIPSLLMISDPSKDDEWYVSRRAEVDAIADANSFVGGLLRL
jgi:hypothetical protein